MTSDPNPLSPPRAAAGILEAVERGESVALLLLVDEEAGEGRGRRLLVSREWSRGSLGSGPLDRAAERAARRALEGEGPEEGIVEVGPELESEGEAPADRDASGEDDTVRVYMEVHHPQPELVVVGAGHIAQPLSTLGSILGCRVFVLDDRPEFATRERFPEAEDVVKVDFDDPFADVPIRRHSHLVLVTRGHKYDYECLRRVLRADPMPAYIGMIGSRRRVRATYAQLMDEGIGWERISRVRAPVGLDLEAETPGEIAVAVAAEIVQMWRGGTGQPLREQERVLERFFDEDGRSEPDGSDEAGPESTDEAGPESPSEREVNAR